MIEPHKIGRPIALPITTIVELEALPEYSVVIDHEGDAWQKRHYSTGPWIMAGFESEPESNGELLNYAPLLLVHVPAEGWQDGGWLR